MDTLIASGYNSCDGQARVTRIILETFSLITLLKTFGIMQNGEKTFVEPILLEGICYLAQWIWPPRKVSLDLMK